MTIYWKYVQFLVAPAFLKESDLSFHWGVCVLAWLVDCLWTVIPIIDTRWQQ